MHNISIGQPFSAEGLADYLRKSIAGSDLWAKRRHLLDTKDLSRAEVDSVLSFANACKQLYAMGADSLGLLSNHRIANLFYENSTRTRTSFELAARKLGATVVNLDIGSSSVAKGETINDTAEALIAMGVSAIVQRHSASGSAHQLSRVFGDKVHVVNAGDGWNAHPTQALLDLMSMREVRGDVSGAKVAIIGDITHSRVARSNIWLLQKQGADIHLAGPPTLLPSTFADLGVTVHDRLEPALENCDFVMALRLQMERQQSGLIPSIGEYKRLYRLDHRKIRTCKPDVRILHPGPINRGIEITDALAADPEISLVSTQVTNGVAVRMAVLYLLLAGQENA
jgi:aspartate carbamoyltransferase catalytic subunit